MEKINKKSQKLSKHSVENGTVVTSYILDAKISKIMFSINPIPPGLFEGGAA